MRRNVGDAQAGGRATSAYPRSGPVAVAMRRADGTISS